MTVIVDDVQDIHNGMNEINQALADHDRSAVERDIRIEALDNLQAQIQHQGASRTLVEELQTVSGQDDMLLQRGIAVESFTSFPSRTGKTIALEMSDDIKNGLIGAAVAAGLFIVYKIGKMIWKFFKKKKGSSSDIKSNNAKIERAIKFQAAIDGARHGDKELDEALKKIEEETQELFQKRFEEAEGKWTILLKECLSESGELNRLFMKFIHAYDELEKDAIEINNLILKLPFQASQRGGEEIRKYVKESVEPMVGKVNLERLNKDLEDINSFYERVKEESTKPAQVSLNDLEKALKTVTQNRMVWDKLDKSMGVTALTDEKTVESVEKKRKEIQEVMKKPLEGLDKVDQQYVKNILDDALMIYRKTSQIAMKLIACLALVGAQFNAYQEKILGIYNAKMGFFSKVANVGKGDFAKVVEAHRKNLVQDDEEDDKD